MGDYSLNLLSVILNRNACITLYIQQTKALQNKKKKKGLSIQGK